MAGGVETPFVAPAGPIGKEVRFSPYTSLGATPPMAMHPRRIHRKSKLRIVDFFADI
jgi:hypothetical protein